MSLSSRSLCQLVSTTIGKKIIVALTGIVLVLFLVGHLSGNLLVFLSPEAFDDYAEFLHHSLHGGGVWIARAALLVCFVLHIAFTISLTRISKKARINYEYDNTVQASKSSRIMIWSGLTILAFVIFHLLHYSVRVDAELREIGAISPWKMVIVGFSTWYVVLFYLISLTLLCSHLSHGVASIFQTLGLRTDKTAGAINAFAKIFTLVIYLGFISIPIAIFVFGYGK